MLEWKIKGFNELSTKELYNILKERINVFVVEQDCIYFDCDDKDLDSTHIFIQDKENIIAYLRVIPPGISYKETSIGRVIVHKNYRGKGLATELLKKALEYIKYELKQSEVRISSQEHLISLYSSVGFKVESDSYLEDGIPHVEMFCENIDLQTLSS